LHECERRKPKTGMLEQAARERGLDLNKSFVVGDRHSDVEVARDAGARSILVRTGFGEGELAWHAKNWRISRSSWLPICPKLLNGFCRKCGDER
jgi:D-glycero-D-manno-heptose 1,7-bisphosphate phosphatase